MSKKMIKIMGILLCMLVSVQIMPIVIGMNTNSVTNTDSNLNQGSKLITNPQPKIFVNHFRHAIIIGRLTQVHIIGKIVIAHANKMYYFGRSLFRINMGMLKNKIIIFRENSLFHMMHLKTDTLAFGRVRGLTIF